MRPAALALVAVVAGTATAGAQTAAVEVTQSAGVSSESIRGGGVQGRALAEPVRGLRLTIEGAWGDRTTTTSDVFGTAYPYDGRVQVIEAYAEWIRPGNGLRAIRAGRYRTPFGLSSASDHAYLGFLRPPLIRYGGYFALSSGYLEHGLDLLAGVSRVSLELNASRPGDVGAAIRRPGTTTSGRLEVAAGPFVAGLSAIDTPPYLPAAFARGRTRFAGLDLRAMYAGIQVRGEWIDGRPFDGTSTTGGYLDAIVHTRRMGRLTALGRVERLDYDTPNARFALKTKRATAALRLRVWQGLSLSAGLTHQQGRLTQRTATAFDAGVTWTFRRDLAAAP